ncbi:cAMP-regulated D2 protein-like [Dreissena polymorpha]|uniref:Carboxylic ester hydrolase n=1 Tax=Dreissena polymorpha TaxID=45954 RepID=A0A9D4G832_DREPO|nr:cAMP-regulated D2 protein-like [Dreissena polymorpha]KAH3811992.1 hypothetical protein DPMN_140412 [Dreissena polymorpha]
MTTLHKVVFVISVTLIANYGESWTIASPIVKTTTGLVQGATSESAQEFLGIPFAQPPIGERRWADPTPALSWEPNILNATEKRPGCPQKFCTSFLPNTSCPTVTSEDCLFLNIWTPLDANATSGYPVMVFIHGGAFKWGSASNVVYDGSYLARDGRVVVVTIAYRIGLLGFLYTGDGKDDANGNFGINDQRLAMQWIQQNIANFGGDIHKVTLFGQSAGAQSVYIHLMTSETTGLFRAAIIESSPFAVPYRTKGEALLLSKKVCEYLNCREDDLTCLRSKTSDEINDALQAVTFKITGRKLDEYFEPVGPVLNGNELHAQPMDAARMGIIRNIPIMVGTTTEEGRLFVYGAWRHNLTKAEYEAVLALLHPTHFEEVEKEYPADDKPDLRDELSLVVTDYLFACATRNVTRNILNKGNTNVFLYVFDHATSARDVWGIDTFCEGHVCHAEEIEYIFGNKLSSGNFTEDELNLSGSMVTYWSNFAYTMNPNVGPRTSNLSWPSYDTKVDTLLYFKTPENKLLRNYKSDVCKFWDEIQYDE